MQFRCTTSIIPIALGTMTAASLAEACGSDEFGAAPSSMDAGRSGGDAGKADGPLDAGVALPEGSVEPPDLSCPADAATGDAAPMVAYDASACGVVAALDASTCPVEKITFPWCKACFNDGYVEICVPTDDTATACAVQAIAPDAETYLGYGGRIGCTKAQTLILIPIDKERDCLDRYGTSTEAAWSRICAIAGLANVEKVGPTFFP